MTRQTSIDAYRRLVDEGVLPPARRRMYQALYQRGPCTASELYEYLNKSDQRGAIVARLGELRDMGVIREVQERPCTVTSMTAIEWDVTHLVDPFPLVRSATVAEKLAAYRRLAEETAQHLRAWGLPQSEMWLRARMEEIDKS